MRIMKNLIVSIAAAALSICTIAQAVDIQGRLDFDGTKEGVVLTPGKAEGGAINNASWFKDAPEKNKQYICAYFTAISEWKKGIVSFTPEKDGKIILQVKGAWDKDSSLQTWTLIDCIQAEGAEVKNGNFEDGITNWTFQEKDGQKASISDIAKSGSKSIKVAHNYPVTQEIAVKAGQTVTISFWYKAAE